MTGLVLPPGAAAPAAPDAELGGAYEALRQSALDPTASRTVSDGRGVFLGQGMAMWMRRPRPLAVCALEPTPSANPGSRVLVNGVVRNQLVLLLAGMVTREGREVAG